MADFQWFPFTRMALDRSNNPPKNPDTGKPYTYPAGSFKDGKYVGGDPIDDPKDNAALVAGGAALDLATLSGRGAAELGIRAYRALRK